MKRHTKEKGIGCGYAPARCLVSTRAEPDAKTVALGTIHTLLETSRVWYENLSS